MKKSVSLLGTFFLLSALVSGCGSHTISIPDQAYAPAPVTGPTSTQPTRIASPAGTPVTLAQARGTDGAYQSLDFVSERNGWLSIARPDSYSRLDLYKTEDGGAHWSKQLSIGTDNNRVAGSLHFFTEDSGYLIGTSGKELLWTTDGGDHWAKLALPCTVDDLKMITFANPRTGWLLGNMTGAMGSESATLYRTTDGGQSWQEVAKTAENTQSADGSLPFHGDKTGVFFKNDTTGWITGSTNATGHSYLYLTQDGGQHWHQQTLNLPTTARNTQIVTFPPQFVSESIGYLPVQIEQTIHWYRTEDGGMHWLDAGTLPATNPDSLGYEWLDLQVGCVYAGAQLWNTTDGGQHWTQTQLQDNVEGLVLSPDHEGWAFTSHALYQSDTHGQYWHNFQ